RAWIGAYERGGEHPARDLAHVLLRHLTLSFDGAADRRITHAQSWHRGAERGASAARAGEAADWPGNRPPPPHRMLAARGVGSNTASPWRMRWSHLLATTGPQRRFERRACFQLRGSSAPDPSTHLQRAESTTLAFARGCRVLRGPSGGVKKIHG